VVGQSGGGRSKTLARYSGEIIPAETEGGVPDPEERNVVMLDGWRKEG
jgi:hypothetical protein